MKKTLLFLVILLTGATFAQTDNSFLSYGWSNELTHETLPASIVMPGYDQSKIDAEDVLNDSHKDIPWRFGYKYDTNIQLGREGDGKWETVEGGRVWRTVIECPEALSINLLLEDFYIPEGASLYLYDFEKTNKIGAYSSRNNRVERELGTELVLGDKIIVEYFEPYMVTEPGSFTIAHVIHGYRSLNIIQKELEKGLHDSGACNVDVNCPEGDDWGDQIRSVAMIVVGGGGICSGALINNTCEDGRFLFLTANHCLGGSTASWSFRFNWESPPGTEVCAEFDLSTDPGAPYDQTANGATILANSGASDFALLEIDNMTDEEAETWDVYYAGWDRSDDETVTSAVGIHHPRGDLKKICREDNDPYHDVAAGAQVWWIDDWDAGVTEPGSSGSPLFDQNKRIIGQLYGGAAACSGTDDNDAFDYYGRMGVSWTNGASEFLAPGGCGDTEILDGIDAGSDCTGEISATSTDALCHNGSSGTIEVVVSGGTPPYTYDIGDGPVASGTFTDLPAGDYAITVTDDTGCEDVVYVTVDEPAELDAIYSSEDEIFGSDGSVNLTVIGGTGPFTFDWSGPDAFTSTDEDISGLVNGIYECEITDANGCVHVEEGVLVRSQLSITEFNQSIQIYPNPSTGQFTVSSTGSNLTTITVYDLSGRVILTESLSNTIQMTMIDLTRVSSGTYLIELTTEQGKHVQRIVKK